MSEAALTKRRAQTPLGTTDLGEHLVRDESGNPDFDKELETVERELKRLRIRR